jgi:hypothetical protein
VATGRGACVDGPNIGAREAHTVLRFAQEFYAHLPAAIVFTQDDPEVDLLLRTPPVGSAAWLTQLRNTFASRRRAAAAGLVDPHNETSPWILGPCPCSVDVERGFTQAKYGVYRPMHWWLRTFLAPFAPDTNVSEAAAVAAAGSANTFATAFAAASAAASVASGATASATGGSPPPSFPVSLPAAFPRRIGWPRHAQFAVPAEAIRLRSLRWWELNADLTSLPSPLKHLLPRRAGDSERESFRRAKWANFGPYAVDLGPLPPAWMRAPDNRIGANGMDLAMAYERLWFRIFDPALAEALPPFPRCFAPDALAHGPVRCGGASCPFDSSRRRGGTREESFPHLGCAKTDQAGRTGSSGSTGGTGGASGGSSDGNSGGASWLGSVVRSRCLAPGCAVSADAELAMGSALWREWQAGARPPAV